GELAKEQVLQLAVRLAANDKAAELHAYVFTLARYDVSFRVRDRARLLRALCPLGGDEAHTAEMPHVAELSHELLGLQALQARGSGRLEKYRQPQYTVASLALALDRPLAGYAALPEWPLEKPAKVDRGPPGDVASSRAPAAIAIAGLSGRARPAQQGSEYATPRSVADDDLDAFLNSDSDSVGGARVGFVHSTRSLQRTAVVLRQAEIHSDDDSSEESSSDESSDEDDEPGMEYSEKSESESESGSEDGTEDGTEDSTNEESEEEPTDDERIPFLSSDNPFASTGMPDRPPDDPSAFDARPRSGSQTSPLFEDTTRHWQ
ncbi:AP-3 complex subunit beta, partial [Linderina pennispora]